MMQANGLEPGEVPELMSITHPEVITSIHRSYVEAGSDIIYANTFGANTHKVPQSCGYTLEEIIDASVKNAKAAGDENTIVALDVGPLGELLEPMGSLKFEEAYEAFRRTMVQGEKSGADLIVIETMTDLYEVTVTSPRKAELLVMSPPTTSLAVSAALRWVPMAES